MPKRVRPDDKRTAMIACRIPQRLWDFVEKRAESKGITRSAYVERCIQDAYDRVKAS